MCTNHAQKSFIHSLHRHVRIIHLQTQAMLADTHRYIHTCLIHSQSDNLLINTRGEVKIADFGFCVQLTQEKNMRQSMVSHTPPSLDSTPCEHALVEEMRRTRQPMVCNAPRFPFAAPLSLSMQGTPFEHARHFL